MSTTIDNVGQRNWQQIFKIDNSTTQDSTGIDSTGNQNQPNRPAKDSNVWQRFNDAGNGHQNSTTIKLANDVNATHQRDKDKGTGKFDKISTGKLDKLATGN